MVEYVLALIIREFNSKSFSNYWEWVLVKHVNRGWELPGGKLAKGESPRQCIIREVREETGIRAEILSGPISIDNGVVFLMKPSDSNSSFSSKSDPMISEVKWHNTPPENLAWGAHELETILDSFQLK